MLTSSEVHSMLDDLAKSIAERRVVLFVGSGVSAGLGIPTWRELICHIGEELGYDAEIFAAPEASYLTLAEYYKIEKGSIGPLRSWMDKNWNIAEDKLRESKVHEIIAKLNFPIIYTTNYDSNLENSLKIHDVEYNKIVDVRDIANIDPNKTQVIKLHGDFDDDDSIVLTETDYFDRLSFESPLDIKLRADVLERAILFIGYSLTDINVRLLLHKLWHAWALSGYEKHRPRSFIFSVRPDPIQKAVLEQWDVRTITVDSQNPSDALRQFLEQLLERGSSH